MDLVSGYISSILHSFLWAVSCVGLGYFPARRIDRLSRIEFLIIAFVTGCVGWILISLILSAFHVFNPGILKILVYATGGASILAFAVKWVKGSQSRASFSVWHALLAFILLVQLLYTLMPVTAFDALCYHLPLANHMLTAGTIEWTPSIFNSAFPQGFEILQAIALAIGGDASASIVTWLFSVASALCLIAIGNRLRMPQIGIWSAIAVSLTPLWFELGNEPMNELGMAFGILFMLLLIVMQAPGWLFGIGAGWLLSIKYYGLEVAILAFLLWIFFSRPQFRSVLTAIAVAILISGFWYVRNIVIFGNPIFPYFHNIFISLGFPGASGMREYAWDVYSQFDQFASPKTLTGWITAPYRLLTHPSPDFIESDASSWKYTAWLAILWPLAIFPAIKNHRKLIPFFLFLVFTLSLWILVHGIIYLRFLTPLLPLMIFLSLFVLYSWLPAGWTRRIPAALMIPVAIIACLLQLVGSTTAISLFELPMNSSEREIFLDTRIPGYEVISEINGMSPQPVVYYLYGEHARYYCEFPVFMGWRETNGYIEFHEHASSGDDLGRWLDEIGVDVLLVNHGRGAEAAENVRDVLLDEQFLQYFEPKVIQQRFTSVFINRNSDFEILSLTAGSG